MTLVTLPDIIGPATVPLASGTTPVYARFVKLTALAQTCRLGDSKVGAAQGQALPAGQPIDVELDGGDITENFALQQIYVYVPSGGTLTVTYGVA